MKTDPRGYILIGAGGHARVLLDVLHCGSMIVIGAVEFQAGTKSEGSSGVKLLGDDQAVFAYAPDEVLLVNAVGSVGLTGPRVRVYDSFKEKGYSFAQVIHPSAVISGRAELGEGVQVMAGAIIQAGAVLGANVLVNTKASVDHDCVVGIHAVVAPGATVCADARIGPRAFIGAGATVIQGVEIGPDSLIAAGAVVVREIPAGVKAVGVPAKVREK